MENHAALSPDDIKRLMEDRSSVGTQMDVVGKLTAHYNAGGSTALSKSEAEVAEKIFGLLLNRAELQVRALVAVNLKESDKLPPEIARQMAADVREVALPIIEFSPSLTDDDLLKIITADSDQEKLVAIAKRDTVSETISEALVDTKVEKVVSTLVRNETAQINEQTFGKIVEQHMDSAEVMESMMERGTVPVPVVEKLIERISTTMRRSLETKYGSLVEMKELRKAFDQSLEMAGLRMIGLKSTDEQLTQIIRNLEESGKLSPFSALCMGNLSLFEVSLARLLRLPLKNVQMLLADPSGLKALYTRAELPESMFAGVELCMEAIRRLEADAEKLGKHRPILSLVQVMALMQELAEGRNVENLDYMFTLMQHQSRKGLRAKTGEK